MEVLKFPFPAPAEKLPIQNTPDPGTPARPKRTPPLTIQ